MGFIARLLAFFRGKDKNIKASDVMINEAESAVADNCACVESSEEDGRIDDEIGFTQEKGKGNNEVKKKAKATECYDNRELSWLKFNTRVLEEAEDLNNPFAERLSFASIFQSNLDEFFMVRVGSLYDQMLEDEEVRDSKTNMTSKQQIKAILSQVQLLTQRKDADYETLKKGLEKYGIEIKNYSEMNKKDAQYLDAYFKYNVAPILSPQIVDKKQPFPFLKSKDIYAVVVIGDKGSKDKDTKLGIVSCRFDVLPRMIKIPGHDNRFILIEELILHFIPEIFGQFSIKSKSLIRIIRNADIDPDEDMDGDFREIMERLVSRRRRLAPIKLEYTRLMDESVITALCKHLGLKKKYVFHSQAPLDLSFFSEVRDILRNRKELFYNKYAPRIPEDIDMNSNIIKQVEEKDKLLFFPYDSIDPFIRMLNEAAVDPDVVSVKITLYRVANDSKIVEALIRAAENGKEVIALVELRARFDEENNIEWSRRLEDAGCTVLYGLNGLKVHSKLCLITRKRDNEISYITQIGTGNYNEKTSKLYTDLSLLTADQGIGQNGSHVFDCLCKGEVVESIDRLLVAPKCLRNKVLDKMDAQIELAKEGKGGYIGAKINSLTDKTIIDKLMEASQAGVKVELVVRGACCLISQIPGVTDNIEIRSVVGRYLEHSRIYIFGEDEVYIASADFMTRNTTRRVEVAVPLYDENVKKEVKDIFRTLMNDNTKARIQRADGHYEHVKNDSEPLTAQEFFMTCK